MGNLKLDKGFITNSELLLHFGEEEEEEARSFPKLLGELGDDNLIERFMLVSLNDLENGSLLWSLLSGEPELCRIH